jgi:type IV pilus assembly protein PilN
MRLTINLATRRYVNLRQLNLLLALAFAVAGALALYKVTEIAGNVAEISRLNSLGQAGVTREKGPQVSEAQLKTQAARISFANAAIDRKSTNWLALLDRLEEVVPAGVTLTEIIPDRGRVLKLSGATRNFANLRALMENMEHSQHFSEVYLLSQSDAKVGLTQEGLLFHISCKVAP